ncbi:MAG: Tol-Pal system beta propeller repeat protein TolB [Betaproteobacteria bacterium AqS2]|uniref:Tol-Pal system beta propeller repeat protein TolB n=1 Tax=Candidatus Amphirhobacter heronislandensis TaxID=1732024 RepID=A0A930UF57_9GAMM|nr:Tol-Pal system beta propeller repeat protein TolB [Betaproteobacteria bacterium AqS2]
MLLRRLGILALCGLLPLAPLRAAVEIQLESQGVRRIPILIQAFEGEQVDTRQLSRIITDDLDRTGLFRAFHQPVPTLGPFEEPDYDAFDPSQQEYMLVGRVDADGQRVTYQLIDLVTQRPDEAFALAIGPGQERLVAHTIANWLYEKLAGIPGVFTSKIAYVLRTGDKRSATYELKVADYDGFGAQTLIKSPEPIISPEWMPDGNRILYVSYERKKPIVYEHQLLTGQRKVVASFKGNNSSPAMSPDRRWIAVALSESGSTQIHLLSADGTRKLRLRESAGIDTEPVFSPTDPNLLAFVSDSSGSPQIYLRDRASGAERRLTFGSGYNVSPRFSPDGGMLTFIRRDANGFNVHIADSAATDGATVPLTGIDLADSPSFSPNGEMLLFKNDARPNILYTVSINGKITRPFTIAEQGEIKDPAWSPASTLNNWY